MNEVNFKTINVDDLKKRRDSSDAFCLIDVREQHEWDEMHIPHAIHIPKDNLPDLIQATIPDKNKTIYIHCLKGMRSQMAAQTLVQMGYNDVYSVQGGIAAWIERGYPVEKS